MMMSIASLLLISRLATVLVEPVNAFSGVYHCSRLQRLAANGPAKDGRFVATLPLRPHPEGLKPLNAASDDSSSASSSDEIQSDEESSDSDSNASKDIDTVSSEGTGDVSPTDESDKPSTFRDKLKKLWRTNDDSSLTFRQRLAKMGLAAVLSYGWVSNVSYAVCVSIAWYGFSKKTGLSPLAPDQWKPFLAVYAGFFIFNNAIRPLRLGLSIAISRYFDQVVAWVQNKTKFNKSVSIAIVVFMFNIVGTISLMCLGISLASLASGVPVFPSKAALK